MSTTTFAGLGVPTVLCAELARQGIDAPFPIQSAALRDTLAGKDVLGRGRTGSGKTLAFSLPLVARLVGGARRRPPAPPAAAARPAASCSSPPVSSPTRSSPS